MTCRDKTPSQRVQVPESPIKPATPVSGSIKGGAGFAHTARVKHTARARSDHLKNAILRPADLEDSMRNK